MLVSLARRSQTRCLGQLSAEVRISMLKIFAALIVNGKTTSDRAIGTIVCSGSILFWDPVQDAELVVGMVSVPCRSSFCATNDS